MARPLEKTGKNGQQNRPANIEAEIDIALGQDLTTLRKRAQIQDPRSPDFLRSEILVHLIRHALRQANSAATDNLVANTLLSFLSKRCEANLKKKISRHLPDAETLREEIVNDFAMMFANELLGAGDNKLDFFEVRFNMAFARFRIDAVRKHTHRENRKVNTASAEPSDDDDDTEHFDRVVHHQGLANNNDDLEALISRRQISQQLHTAINELSGDDRKAVILHYFYHYKIESTNPDEPTVATLSSVSGRVIQKRLGRARKALRLKMGDKI